jgi:hypothetical protein
MVEHKRVRTIVVKFKHVSEPNHAFPSDENGNKYTYFSKMKLVVVYRDATCLLATKLVGRTPKWLNVHAPSPPRKSPDALGPLRKWAPTSAQGMH